MESASPTAAASNSTNAPGQDASAHAAKIPSLEAVEIELAINSDTLDRNGFVAAVREAVDDLAAEFLFDLPASGLCSDCQRIAVIRLTPKGRAETLLLVKLAGDGRTITVTEPDEETRGLTDFARAFVNVLSQLAPPKSADRSTI